MPSSSWVLQHRPTLLRPSPGNTLLSWHDEWEASNIQGEPVRVRTLFLRGSECRFHCVMCDLWQYTHTQSTLPGALPDQVREGLSDLPNCSPSPRWLKLYNASSFFDAKNVPTDDLPHIASLVRSFERVVVENHPRLLPQETIRRFRDQIQPAKLEIAMGLETVHAEILERLNKQMSVDDFRIAAEACRQLEIDVRVFVLLRLPWMSELESLDWCQRSIDVALGCGARHISIIPVRGGNGALEQLAAAKEFTPPMAHSLEKILSENLSLTKGLVTVDLWDWDKLRGTCAQCSQSRRERMEQMNLCRLGLPAIACERCDAES